MKLRRLAMFIMVAVGGTMVSAVQAEDAPFTDMFFLEDCSLSHRGVNDYYLPLRPGCFLRYEGEEEDEGEVVSLDLTIEVLPGARVVDGVKCAIIRETEMADGELTEISWNFFAICRQHKGVFYFGEEVDIYEEGEVVSHDGAWMAGVDGAAPGLIMPGLPLIGSRYVQEVAPDVAMDRAEHLDNTATVDTPAGTFENCLYVVETSPLEPGHNSFKMYARHVGLVLDNVLRLVEYGCGDDDGNSGDDDSDDESSDNDAHRGKHRHNRR